MQVLTVYAHPNPASFCHALLARFTHGLTDARPTESKRVVRRIAGVRTSVGSTCSGGMTRSSSGSTRMITRPQTTPTKALMVWDEADASQTVSACSVWLSTSVRVRSPRTPLAR